MSIPYEEKIKSKNIMDFDNKFNGDEDFTKRAKCIRCGTVGGHRIIPDSGTLQNEIVCGTCEQTLYEKEKLLVWIEIAFIPNTNIYISECFN